MAGNTYQENFMQKVFETQYAFTRKVLKEKNGIDIDKLTDEQRKFWVKEYILSGAKEFFECLDEMDWKQHTSMGYEGNNFLEEGIDTFKFLINCLMLKGVTPEMFEKKYHEKSLIVNFRYEQEKQMKKIIEEGRRLAFFDIDGVLNHYPIEFLAFVEAQTCTKYNHIRELMSENYQMYRTLKHIYRQSGREGYGCILVEETRDLISKLWKQGISIVLLTARPYRKYNNLFYDTVNWLKENDFIYDLLFFNREKNKFALEYFDMKNLLLFVDDDIENVNRAVGRFQNTFLLKNTKLHLEDDYKHVNEKVKIIEDINEIYEKSDISFL